MADTNPFPRTVASITREGRGPQTHAYDAPDIGPIEFLQLVYRDPLLPMSTRIDAARGLLPYTEPRPACAPSSHVGCTIVIGGLGDHGSASPSPGQINSERQSFPLSASNSHQPQSESQGPLYTETPSNPPFIPDYSTPPTPAELQEIKAAINKLRPDLAHLPIPEPRLCACGHWMFGPCPLGERCCERTKPN